MVMASRRTYADALSWVKSTRRPGGRLRLAAGVFGGLWLAGLAVLGVAAIVSPEDFGQRGARTLSLGWPSLVLVGLVGAGAAGAFALRRTIADVAGQNLRGGYSAEPDGGHAFEAAVNALAACPRALQLRFAAGWVWGPAAAACAGGILALSAAYFTIFAVLARFDVGEGTALIAGGDVVLGLGLLAAASRRLSTWRFANAVYRAVAPGYL